MDGFLCPGWEAGFLLSTERVRGMIEELCDLRPHCVLYRRAVQVVSLHSRH
jgi:hypothetical protein